MGCQEASRGVVVVVGYQGASKGWAGDGGGGKTKTTISRYLYSA